MFQKLFNSNTLPFPMLTLYDKPGCPYCWQVIKVLGKLSLEEGRDYKVIDARPGTQGNVDMIALGGKDQAPFLVDGDIHLYESADIMEYLNKKYKDYTKS